MTEDKIKTLVLPEELQELAEIPTDRLVAMAKRAEERVDAILTIKRSALKITNAYDWVDQNGKPYLQVSGAEKIAGMFDINWSEPEELPPEIDADGYPTIYYKALFTSPIRSIGAIGSRNSHDPFFTTRHKNDEKITLKPGEVELRDVKMAAYTNLLGNGITRILGLRNLTWADLEEYSGIKKDQVGKIDYKKHSTKPETKSPQAKNAAAKTNGAQTSQANGKRTQSQVANAFLIFFKGDDIKLKEAMSKVIGKPYDSSLTLTQEECDKLEITLSELKESTNG